MHRVALAPLAVLLELDALGIVLLVLLGRVVTVLAFRARQGDHRAHNSPLKPSLAIEPDAYT